MLLLKHKVLGIMQLLRHGNYCLAWESENNVSKELWGLMDIATVRPGDLGTMLLLYGRPGDLGKMLQLW